MRVQIEVKSASSRNGGKKREEMKRKEIHGYCYSVDFSACKFSPAAEQKKASADG